MNNKKIAKMLTKDVVDQLHSQTHQLSQRKKPVVHGFSWSERLSAYTWSSKSSGKLFSHLVWFAQITNQASKFESIKNYESRKYARSSLANQILRWGGVSRNNSNRIPHVIGAVIQAAQSGVPSPNTPMNSGWTKIAAIYSAINPEAPPQVIWDSRVSLSVCIRLGLAARRKNMIDELQPAFGHRLGWVPGRGGSRTKLMVKAKKYFPNRYRKWDAHFEGGQIVAEIAKILNSSIKTYGSPKQALSTDEIIALQSLGIELPKKWSPWLVACVLFMDGQ